VPKGEFTFQLMYFGRSIRISKTAGSFFTVGPHCPGLTAIVRLPPRVTQVVKTLFAVR
jgi:hypothetical protein